MTSAKEQLLERLLSRPLAAAPGGLPHRTEGRVPLSASQEGIWFLTQRYPDSSEHNVYESLRLEVAPEPAALSASVQVLLDRHDALRLQVVDVGGEPLQEDAGAVPPPVDWHDLAGLPPEKAEGEALQLAVAASRRLFRLDEAPLWRLTAIRMPGGQALLVLVIHHLVADHASWQRILRELTGLLQGATPAPAPASGYLDWCAWSRSAADPPRRARDLDYWLRRLAAPPALELPTARSAAAAAAPSRDGYTERLTVPADVAARMHRLAEEEGTTPFAVGLAAYKAFLARISGQTDLLVGTALSGRDHPAVEDLVGCFVKLVPLRTTIDPRASFRTAVRAVHDTVVDAQDHQSVPYQEVVAELGVVREGGREIVQTFFGMQQADSDRYPGAVIGPSALTEQNGTGRWELACTLTETPEGIAGYLGCLADLLDRETLACLAATFLRLLGALTAAPDDPLRRHPLVSGAEQARILGMHPYERPSHAHTTLAQPFEEQCRRTPAAVAVEAHDGVLTYAELDERANRVANFLLGLGAGRGARVALCMERSAAMMVALYGVVKSGATYVPLDPELPDPRLAFALEDTEPVAVLVDGATAGRLDPARSGGARWRVVDAGSAEVFAAAADDPVVLQDGTAHWSHLLYTSGSTGKPKAVACLVEQAVADILSMQERYPYGSGDTTIFKTSFGFDTSLWEVFWPLWFGARVVVCPPGAQGDVDTVADLVERHRVTALYLTPTMLQAFVDGLSRGRCSSLRRVFSGGETVTPRLRDDFQTLLDADLVNGWGPTEVGCAVNGIVPEEPGAPNVPLGRPHPNFRVYVLDDDLHVMPVGLPGEAYVGGEVGVNAGYFGRPALTAERYLPDPFGAPGTRMYRTGDVCRYRPDGLLEHLGRVDRQVKIGGVRVELGEIEAVVCEHPEAEQCVALPVLANGVRQVVAFVRPRPGTDPSPQELREHAAAALPRFMLPASFQVIGHIPLNVNGKVDATALLAHWHGNLPSDDDDLVPPANELEAGLARLYARLLGLTEVSVTDSFFELGGHSLLIFRLIAACREELDVAPTVTDVFNAPSVRELATLVAGV